ncbi:MAG: hypothetical protein LBQ32_02820 [Burkholderiaceae bacterium]|nr:hypothetical protein [Burkholderiaceae bacterium]
MGDLAFEIVRLVRSKNWQNSGTAFAIARSTSTNAACITDLAAKALWGLGLASRGRHRWGTERMTLAASSSRRRASSSMPGKTTDAKHRGSV